ncbi:nuclear receptor 2C2-associated protein-like [Lineus longissimus]|uniref:nuclear receptor 2C2-associated protein-like n=1 Tax=Lineus longissimus TaxID=88925 RepID=UPI00315DB86D
MTTMSASIKEKISSTRVSSVLNRDVKQFGKKYLFDGDDETCWNSDQGSPQWIQVEFKVPVIIQELHLQFQGGFAGKDCIIEGAQSGEELTKLADFYPEDVNKTQIFSVEKETSVSLLRITFNNSTDFFGRITVYKLDIVGSSTS